MHHRKFLNLLFSIWIAASLLLGGSGPVFALEQIPPFDRGEGQQDNFTSTDQLAAAVRNAEENLLLQEMSMAGMAMPGEAPHYFSAPNYANSPLRLADALIELQGGGGTDATAAAKVDPVTGAITEIEVTSPGSGYTSAPSVVISTASVTPSEQASATAAVNYSGVVTAITLDAGGLGYTTPAVELLGGGGTGATAKVTGGVDFIAVTNGGSGYEDPVVDIIGDGIGATATATMEAGMITGITVTAPGLGYSSAPTVIIKESNGGAGEGATTTATLTITEITLESFGSGYVTSPTVAITDTAGVGSGAAATATVTTSGGSVTSITVTNGGSGYVTPGIKKFVDTLPGLGQEKANNLGQYIPVAVADTTTYPGSDYYEIAVVEYQEQMHSDLPPTRLRGYVQLSTSVTPGAQVPLTNPDGSPILLPDGSQALAVDRPHYMGPLISAEKDKPVRILFRNLLPTGAGGNLFIPVDTTVMGSGMGPGMGGMAEMDPQNPMCGRLPKPMHCYSENRATLHLHGGISPWISDGTPHQWITPANENTPYPKGVSVQNVPDMPDPGPGAMTFFYTNQQSARLMFYHDHSWGITRLNVYAGEAAAYLITDPTEQALIDRNIIPADQIPLVIQDKTFVPDMPQLAMQDPNWDLTRWGGPGDLWVPHVYSPAQNPGDSSGVNEYGRWAYGPWFWPPTTGVDYGPIPNPYYDPNCDPDVTWCEPELMPGVPYVSMGMEAFNDTPVVNGTLYPTVTLDPKSYRLRILNAANDRFWNLSLYQADASGTEVALNPDEVAAALDDTTIFPTPVVGTEGPDWIQIGTEGGFLPAPVVIPAHPVTWVNDPTVFNAGNVDQHSLLLGPAERADVIVDFSAYAGQTLILYNDAPAAFPARDARYDYYTGNADLTDTGGAPSTPPGYGPNTRTVMQIKVNPIAPAPAFDLGALNAAFAHHADGSGVFESSQNPIIVGQNAYNSAYGTSFNLNGSLAGLVQIFNTQFTFKTLSGNTLTMPLQPKQIQDEMGEAFEQEYGRMSGFLGLESPNASAGLQNMILYPYVNPASEILEGIELPDGTLDVTPIASADDGTQIWKITHNGVDTHPIHFHLYDVQLINRVGWDGIVRRPDPNELGWKDTVRVSPLEDTIVAMRPVLPKIPFGVPDSIRLLNPMMPEGSTAMFNSTDAYGNPVTPPITNQVVNFGWEYVWHCHILSHEEMDMMRPLSVHAERALPSAPVLTIAGNPIHGEPVDLLWTDGTPTDYFDPASWGHPDAEVGYRIERAAGAGAFEVIGTALANAATFTDAAVDPGMTYTYQIIAFNAAGDSPSAPVTVVQLPLAPSALTAAAISGAQVDLAWTDNTANEDGFIIERCQGAGCTDFSPLAQVGADVQAYSDTSVQPGTTFAYRLYATNTTGTSGYSNTAEATTPEAVPPAAPTGLTAAAASSGTQVELAWTDNASDEDGFGIERCQGTVCTDFVPLAQVGADVQAYSDTTVQPGATYTYRLYAFSAVGSSGFSNTAEATTPAAVPPAAPTNLTGAATGAQVNLSWTDNADNETDFTIQRCRGFTCTNFTEIAQVGAGLTAYSDMTVLSNSTYRYRVYASNAAGSSGYSNIARVTVPRLPSAPTSLAATLASATQVNLGWTDNATNETGFRIERCEGAGCTNFVQIGEVGTNVRAYSDMTVQMNVTYVYRVYAYNANGNSGYSNTAAVTVETVTAPLAPSNLTATAVRVGRRAQVTLQWMDNATNETSFTIQRSTNASFTTNVVTVNGVAADATSYVQTNVPRGRTFYYRIQAVNSGGTSAWSDVVTVTTP